MEVKDLQVPEPHLATNVDTVVFIVEGNQYRLEHTTDNSGLCGSGGTIGNFGRLGGAPLGVRLMFILLEQIKTCILHIDEQTATL